MTKNTRNPIGIEQIKNNTNIVNDICKKFKIFLEKDNFEITKSKSRKLLESKIIESDSKMIQLKDLQQRSDKAISRLETTLRTKSIENNKLKESIMLCLNVQVKK
jgi:hypothetical protein